MIHDPREVARVRTNLMAVAVLSWGVLLLEHRGAPRPAHDPLVHAGRMPPSSAGEMVAAIEPSLSLASRWALMLTAMMSPTLILPVISR